MSHDQIDVVHGAECYLRGFVEAAVAADHRLIHVQNETLIPTRVVNGIVDAGSRGCGGYFARQINAADFNAVVFRR